MGGKRSNLGVVQWWTGSGSSPRYYHYQHRIGTRQASPSALAGDDLIRRCASVPPPPGRLPPQFRKSVKSFFSPYFWSSEQPQSSCEQLLMRGTLGGTHRASIMDMIVDHHLARPGASPCPQPWLMKLVHTLQPRHLAHLDGLRLLWIVSGAQKSPKTSRKREWVDVQVNGVSESRIATTSTRAHVSQ